eukprot:SAG25_NODE_4714_length_763_cov_1.350904_2_plen_64_part_01
MQAFLSRAAGLVAGARVAPPLTLNVTSTPTPSGPTGLSAKACAQATSSVLSDMPMRSLPWQWRM